MLSSGGERERRALPFSAFPLYQECLCSRCGRGWGLHFSALWNNARYPYLVSFPFPLLKFIDGRLDLLNSGEGFRDIFEEEINMGEYAGKQPLLKFGGGGVQKLQSI